ncbi:hypothetical protein [Streptomyces sp. NPDC044948]|uniref:hypothetical protein n=1 Tax=Streptomyces sp. NPDC044948 TaxID=3157092 RepID=UPI0033F1E5AA
MPADGFSADEMLRWVVSAEHFSEHSLGQAIVAGGAERGISPASVSAFDSVTGLAAAMVLFSLSVVGNANRLRRFIACPLPASSPPPAAATAQADAAA